MAKRKPKERPKVYIPVYYAPSDDDFDKFLQNPEKSAEGTEKFYSTLRYPDAEVEVELWTND